MKHHGINPIKFGVEYIENGITSLESGIPYNAKYWELWWKYEFDGEIDIQHIYVLFEGEEDYMEIFWSPCFFKSSHFNELKFLNGDDC